MSEKRFRLTEEDRLCILYDNRVLAGVGFSEIEAEKIVDKLNEQQDTIKSKDKQLERLYNYFQYYLKDEMSGNAFSEMWDFVKEDEDWEDDE